MCPDGLCGNFCILDDPCLIPNICQNEGVCIEMCTDVADYVCNCTEGYGGKNCTQFVSSFKLISIILSDYGATIYCVFSLFLGCSRQGKLHNWREHC